MPTRFPVIFIFAGLAGVTVGAVGDIDASAQDGDPSSAPTRRVAVTVDDLPLADAGQHNRDRQREIVESLCRVFTERSIPVTGFFNLDQGYADLVALWSECGVAFGNHTWSHPRLNDVGIDAYLEDLERGHVAIREQVGEGAPIFFRYPYLNQGFDPAVRDAIRAKLVELDSRIAPVTIDTWDWLYSRGYTQAIKDGDPEEAERFHQSWRWNLEETTEQAEFFATSLFGREPPQILLLHGNEINSLFLGEYLDWLTARGYEFVTLAEALADPAYHEADPSLSPTGDSHWLRLRRSRQLSAD